MVDGLNLVTASGEPSGQNTHEGGMVALMTGVNALGKGSTQQDWAAGGASMDQLLLANSPMLGGPTQANKTMFGSLQLAADTRSDRDEVSPRVMSYQAADRRVGRPRRRPAAASCRDPAAERLQPRVRRLADRERTRRSSWRRS